MANEFRIAEICKERGITQKDLADKIGISRVGLSKAINGNTTIATLKKIAEALEINISDLFEVNNSDFTALIDSKGELHRFDNIEALERFIASIK